MFTRLIWTIWTLLSAVPRKAVKFNNSFTHSYSFYFLSTRARLCGFELWIFPWLWPWIFKVKFCKSCIVGMAESIDMEWKGCESTGCLTQYVAFSYDLDLGFSWSNFEKLYPWSGVANWHGTKGMWVSRKSDPLWTLTSPTTLTLDFQGHILK